MGAPGVDNQGVHGLRGWILPALGVAAATVWGLLRSGANVVANIDVVFSAAWAFPARLSQPNLGFYTDSPVVLLMIRGLGLEPGPDYYRTMLGLALAGMGLLAWWTARATSGAQSWRAARLTLLAPLGGVLYTWIGFYDPLTVLAWTLVLWLWWLGRGWLLLVGGLLIGVQHFEHGLLGASALALTWLAVRTVLPDRLAQLNPLWIVPGVLLGKGLLTLGFILADTGVSGRSDWLSAYLREWTVIAINSGPILLWSLFAGTWALVVAAWLSLPGSRSRLLLAGAFAIGIAGLLLSGDRPRVFVLVMAPSLAVLTVAYLRSRAGSVRELRIVETVCWLAPPVALWGGTVAYEGALDQLLITWGALTG